MYVCVCIGVSVLWVHSVVSTATLAFAIDRAGSVLQAILERRRVGINRVGRFLGWILNGRVLRAGDRIEGHETVARYWSAKGSCSVSAQSVDDHEA